MEGWIKLHRKILDWEWYKDYPVRILFEHLLLTANYEEKKWKGQQINKGQLITSIAHLSEQTGLSVQEVRTALEKLKSTNEITNKSTNKGRVITIENYTFYQGGDFESNKQINKQINRRSTTNNNDNKYINNNNIYINKEAEDFESEENKKQKEYFDSFIKELKQKNIGGQA